MRPFLFALAAAVSVPPPASAAAPPAPTGPVLHFVFSARVTLGPAIEYGTVDGKRQRFVPITGGTVSGPRLNGTVLPGGGDWQAIGADGLTEIAARYAIRADDGTAIAVTNPGVRVASPAVIERLTRGEAVPADAYYFRTTPRFEVAAGPHDWLRARVFVARGTRAPDHVVIDVFAAD